MNISVRVLFAWIVGRAIQPESGPSAGLSRNPPTDFLSLHSKRKGSVKIGWVTFEWDARKASANLKKHHVAFEDATTVFLDPLAITFADPDHSFHEQREITIGYTMKKHLVFVSHGERGRRIRIISARPATRTERRQYEEGIGG